MEKDTVQVVAPPGQMEQVAKALIRLADHPHDVVWASRGGHFEVPEEVAVRYAAEQAGELAAAAEAKAADGGEAKPRSRRRSGATQTKADTLKASSTLATEKKTSSRASRKTAAAEGEPAASRRRSSRKKKGES